MSTCNNLPSILDRNNYSRFADYFNDIKDEVINSIVGLSFKNRTIYLQHPHNDKTIRHIISKKDDMSGYRNVDISRAERITWIKLLLTQAVCANCKQYLIWAKLSNQNRPRWYIYCVREKYVIILEEYGDNALYLITAFNVTPQKDREFRRAYRYFLKYGCT